MNHYMVIFDEDKKYAERLASYLNMEEGFSFVTVVCTKREELMHFCDENMPKVVLISEKFYEETKARIKCETMALSATKSGLFDNVMNIYKYQSAEKIMRDILKGLASAGTVSYITGRATDLKIIAFYTPVKRSFCTSMSLAMGQYLGKGHRTLYLNFEAFSGFKGLFECDFENSLADVVYFQESGKSGFGLALAGMVEKIDNLDIVAPFENPVDLVSIQTEKWLKLLEIMERETDYEYLLLDLSESVQGLFDILKVADIVITPVGNEEIEICKVVQYEECLKMSGYDEVLMKTKKCNVGNLKRSGNVRNLCKGDFGEYVKGVLTEIIADE